MGPTTARASALRAIIDRMALMQRKRCRSAAETAAEKKALSESMALRMDSSQRLLVWLGFDIFTL
jgi:hypothetical protein